jgi:hypothetical protein
MNSTLLLTRLAAIPERIAQAVAGWTAAELAQHSADGWSAAQLLAHLRASDAILSHRVYALLVRDGSPLPAFDERRWAEVAGYGGIEFSESLRRYALRRSELIAALERISPEDWQRTGMHEELGPISLTDVIRKLVDHDEEHCAQLEALTP